MQKYLAIALGVGIPALTAAQGQCPESCSGTTEDGVSFDLSDLMGTDYVTQDTTQSQTYYLNVCGTSETQCPDDAGDPPVTQGTAVQTVGDSGCYVLGAYEGDNCLWTSNPGGNEGIELVLDDGSNDLCSDGSPRQVTIDFLCPDSGSSGPLVPDSWTAVNLPDSCQYTYTFETCAACSGGCGSNPPNTPSGGPPQPSKGGAFGATFLIILAVSVSLYMVGGALYNYKVNGARGADVMRITPGFWSSLWVNVRAGVSFTLSGFRVPEPSKYDGMGPGPQTSSDVSYQADAGAGSVDF